MHGYGAEATDSLTWGFPPVKGRAVPLEEQDKDRGVCHDCLSPTGKLADLDIAIRASGDSPERIPEWPGIRHCLRKRFGHNLSGAELWERFTDLLRAEGRLQPNDYLRMPLYQVRDLPTVEACPDAETKKSKRGMAGDEGRSDDQAVRRLLSVFTDGLADDRFDRATTVLENNNLTANEKLTKMPITLGSTAILTVCY